MCSRSSAWSHLRVNVWGCSLLRKWNTMCCFSPPLRLNNLSICRVGFRLFWNCHVTLPRLHSDFYQSNFPSCLYSLNYFPLLNNIMTAGNLIILMGKSFLFYLPFECFAIELINTMYMLRNTFSSWTATVQLFPFPAIVFYKSSFTYTLYTKKIRLTFTAKVNSVLLIYPSLECGRMREYPERTCISQWARGIQTQDLLAVRWPCRPQSFNA